MINQLQQYFQENMEKYLMILREMVSINSFTANPNGVNALGNKTAEVFEELGFTAEYIQSTNPDFGKHLVLTREGFANRRIGLISHLDTVFPLEEEMTMDFNWKIDGDRIFGPGTNDIKGGTAMIFMVLDALQKFAKENYDAITWIILVNAAEERWSNDFGELCRQRLSKDALAALVFEAGYYDEDQFALVTARKGMAIYDILVEGKSAHAGNGHSSGANAITQIAEIINQIHALTDYERELTFNVGVLTGGTVPNRVPHSAEARGEMRAFSKEVFIEGVEKLLELNNLSPLQSTDGVFSCGINIRVILENPPWPPNPNTEKLFLRWQKSAEDMNVRIIREQRGGLSDGNQLWDFVPTIDGLGPNGRNAHCSESSVDGSKEQEFVTISSFVPKATLNTLAILSLIEGV